MSITITDLFCGAGGSSIGAELAGGTLKLGLNHWARAIETHAANFTQADHDCADVSALTTAQIRRYPDSDILLASPECTNHSLAKGARRRKPQAASLFEDGPAGDDEQDRSRATMWDVIRFAEQKIIKGHPYRAIVVENVVDAHRWGYGDDGGLFAAWLQAMTALGYSHEIAWVNSMFCPPTPQSRDRMYVVFWQRGMRAPNLRIEPPSWCPSCRAVVAGRQSWKRPERPWGRYGAQYVFRCPICIGVVHPGAFPAATAIDWALPAGRIGDRGRPLAAATRERIRRGLERLAREPFAIRLLQGGQPRPLTLPLFTQTQRHDAAMVIPVAGNTWEATPGMRARDPDLRPSDTVHGTMDRAIVMPYSTKGATHSPAMEPVGTITQQNKTALVMARTQNEVPRDPHTEPGFTMTTNRSPALVVPGEALLTRTGHKSAARLKGQDPAVDPTLAMTTQPDMALVYANRAHSEPHPASEAPAQTVATGGHLGVVVAHYDPGWARWADAEPFGTVTARDHHSLVMVVPYDSSGRGRDADTEPSPTLSTRDRVAVVWGDDEIDDCRFRMFELGEIARTMAMERHVDGEVYRVLGNKRERMAQYGNAVTPPVMQTLVERLLEVL